MTAISDWITSGTSEPFVLTGYAGTGKTSITRIITKALAKAGITVALMSPTHKAKRVLSGATGSAATTIHAFFKMSALDTEIGKNLSFSSASGEKMSDADIIIIDESSMIDDKLVAEILEISEESGAKVLFIGDCKEPIKNSLGEESFWCLA